MYQNYSQQAQMVEDLSQITCSNNHYNTRIEYISKNSQKGSKELLCSKCIENFNNPPSNLIFIQDIIETIEQEKRQCYIQTENATYHFIQDIEKLVLSLRDYQAQMHYQIQNLIESSNNWIENLNYYKSQKLKYKLLDEIENLDNLHLFQEELRQQSLTFDVYEINKINENNIEKVFLGIEKINQKVKECSKFQGMANAIIKNANNFDYFQPTKMKINSQKLISDKIEDQLCNALAFNSDESLLATAADKNIKIWKFQEGKLTENVANLQEHLDQVVCLVFHPIVVDLLMSGSKDGIIRFWRDPSQSKWKQVESLRINISYPISMILNQYQNQLIVGCFDGSIKINLFNVDRNKANEQQRLDKHTKPVYSISLNSKCNQFVSSSSDKQLIIWEKNDAQNWDFKYVVDKSINDICYRAGYFGDDTIVFQQKRNGNLHFLKLQNNKFSERTQLKLAVTHQDPEVECFFPIIYNSKNQVLVVKHFQHVYIIKQNKQQYQIACQPIDCQNPYNYGTLTKDGQYLVIWENITRKFKVYELQY
ncbi:unnamed protein product (macronuclear) [Paramecium tetraurelia]|uniref:Uncharacterized protein n=1 Tax=Paramecium tetraurelia TaxID=5888 RepID=A0D0F6_PARTE|nr:uncharacterized protein GSPATT00012075001 [Paramecium tetraurelia]CAK76523.1 unnamed protein product [Paramecium tetraurelia]|eukprot:XP_001443920.1 hypothetical protein (macronuclear) [Paramecium tetraurelia strain d4-2]